MLARNKRYVTCICKIWSFYRTIFCFDGTFWSHTIWLCSFCQYTIEDKLRIKHWRGETASPLTIKDPIKCNHKCSARTLHILINNNIAIHEPQFIYYYILLWRWLLCCCTVCGECRVFAVCMDMVNILYSERNENILDIKPLFRSARMCLGVFASKWRRGSASNRNKWKQV